MACFRENVTFTLHVHTHIRRLFVWSYSKYFGTDDAVKGAANEVKISTTSAVVLSILFCVVFALAECSLLSLRTDSLSNRTLQLTYQRDTLCSLPYLRQQPTASHLHGFCLHSSYPSVRTDYPEPGHLSTSRQA